jgi:hypothetical protein
MQQNSIVSSILLQENRFSPLPAAGFFFAFAAALSAKPPARAFGVA